MFDESIAKDLKKLFRFYDTCPEDFKDFDDGEFSAEFVGPGLDIPGLQNLYVGGALLQGTLYYPKEAAEFGGSIASCDLFEGYKKLKDVSLPKGYSRKNMACCILCGWPEKPSLFGKCKKCGAKYVTRKEEDPLFCCRLWGAKNFFIGFGGSGDFAFAQRKKRSVCGVVQRQAVSRLRCFLPGVKDRRGGKGEAGLAKGTK